MSSVEVGSKAPDVQLSDFQGRQVSLSALWKDRPAVLLFLRHSGCPCTWQELEGLRKYLPRLEAADVRVGIIMLSRAEAVARMFALWQAKLTLLIDPHQQAYRAYGLGRGGFWQLAGPQVWMAALKAIFRGQIGKPAGDVRQLGGAFLVDPQGLVRYAHRASHSADFPDLEAILARLAEVTIPPSELKDASG